MNDPNSILRKYYADPILANPTGHELISDVLISYFQNRICAAWAAATGTSHEILPGPGAPSFGSAHENTKQPTDAKGLFGGVQRVGGAAGAHAFEPMADGGDGLHPNPNMNGGGGGNLKENVEQAQKQPENPTNRRLYPQLRVPSTRINQRPSSDPYEEIAPFCASANDLINPLPASLFSGSGWSVFHPAPGSAELSSHAHYWYSTLPTSRLRVGVQVGAGDIGVYYLREPRSVVGEGSAVECWVDDNVKGAVVIENSAGIGEPTPALEIIDHHVTGGAHYVECQLSGEEDDRNVVPFKIIGIFST